MCSFALRFPRGGDSVVASSKAQVTRTFLDGVIGMHLIFPRQSRDAQYVYWSMENGNTKRPPSLAVPNPCGIVRKNGWWEQLSWTSPAEILAPIINFKAGIPYGMSSWRVGRFPTLGDIWSRLKTFLVVTAGERGQDIVKHHKAKDPWRIYDPEC